MGEPADGPTPPPDREPTGPTCAECGASLADDQTYCIECGTPTPRAPRLGPRGRAGALVAAALIALGVGAGALAYAVADGDDGPGGATSGATAPVGTDGAPVPTDMDLTVPTDVSTGDLPPATDGFPAVPTTDDFPVFTEQPGDDPVDPIDPLDPDEPVDPVDPDDPVDPVDPADPDPFDPDPIDPGTADDWPGTDGWTVILASTRSEDEARRIADSVAAGGEEAGVLFSSDYVSLNPGYWVVFSGSFSSRAEAVDHTRSVSGRHPGAYPREIRS